MHAWAKLYLKTPQKQNKKLWNISLWMYNLFSYATVEALNMNEGIVHWGQLNTMTTRSALTFIWTVWVYCVRASINHYFCAPNKCKTWSSTKTSRGSLSLPYCPELSCWFVYVFAQSDHPWRAQSALNIHITHTVKERSQRHQIIPLDRYLTLAFRMHKRAKWSSENRSYLDRLKSLKNVLCTWKRTF